MKRNKQSYSKEFKLNAVKLISEGGRKATDVARELNIHLNTLYNWKNQLSEKGEKDFSNRGSIDSKDEEIRHLRAQVKHLQEEREILKEAAIFFAKEGKS